MSEWTDRVTEMKNSSVFPPLSFSISLLSYSRVSFFLFLEGGFAFYEFCKKEKREGIEQKHSRRANTIQSGSDLRRKAKRELEQSLWIRACVVASVLEGEGEGKERSDRSLCKYRSISRGVKGKENIGEDRRDREDRRIRAGDRFSFAPSSDLFLRRPSPPIDFPMSSVKGVESERER